MILSEKKEISSLQHEQWYIDIRNLKNMLSCLTCFFLSVQDFFICSLVSVVLDVSAMDFQGIKSKGMYFINKTKN